MNDACADVIVPPIRNKDRIVTKNVEKQKVKNVCIKLYGIRRRTHILLFVTFYLLPPGGDSFVG